LAERPVVGTRIDRRLQPFFIGGNAGTTNTGAINARQNVYLTGTTQRGRFVLRICVLSFRTHMDRMQQCILDIQEAVADATEGTRGQ
jgi:hypothetical protein